MNRIFHFFLFLLLSTLSFGQPCTIQSTSTVITGTKWEDESLFSTDFIEFSNGNIIVATKSSEPGNMQNNNLVTLTRKDRTGKEIWSKNYGQVVVPSQLTNHPTELFLDMFGDILFTYTDGKSMHLVKVNGIDGTWIAEHNYIQKEGEDIVWDIKQFSNGDYLLSGHTNYEQALGTEGFLMRLDREFEIVWSNSIGQKGKQAVDVIYESVIVNGDIYSLGYMMQGAMEGNTNAFLLHTNSSGLLVKNTMLNIAETTDHYTSIMNTNDGNLLLVGTTGNDNTNYKEQMIASKVDLTGSVLWSSTFGSKEGSDHGFNVVETSQNEYVLVGYTEKGFGISGSDMLLAGLASNTGNLNWTKIMGESKNETGISLKHGLDYGYILTGTTDEAGQKDLVIIRMNDCFEGSCNSKDVTGETVSSQITLNSTNITSLTDVIPFGKKETLSNSEQGPLTTQEFTKCSLDPNPDGLAYDGDDYGTISAQPGGFLDGFNSADFAFEAFIHLTGSKGNNHNTMLSNKQPNGLKGFSWGISDLGVVRLVIKNTEYLTTANTNLYDGNCHSIGIQRTSPGSGSSKDKLDFYVDGIHIETIEINQNTQLNSNQPFFIGKDPSDPIAGYIGEIKEVRIWDGSATPNFSDAMQTSLVGNESGLVANYDFGLNPNGMNKTANGNDITFALPPHRPEQTVTSCTDFGGGVIVSTQLKSPFCGATEIRADDIIEFNKVLSGSYSYSYKIMATVIPDDGSPTQEDEFVISQNQFTLGDFPNVGYILSAEYIISIEPLIENTTVVFTPCTVTTVRPLILDEELFNTEGVFGSVFDRWGNEHALGDVRISDGDEIPGEILSKSATATCPSGSGFFELHFVPGSGMESATLTSHIERRNVICQVYKDISDFLVSPLDTSSLGNKVHIKIENIAVLGAPANALGAATSYYILPNNSAPKGGLIEGEIWKTINSGIDSYNNVGSGTFATGGTFYHGLASFNFGGSISWNTNLGVLATGSQRDLYTVALHEVTHSLGFSSLIDLDGKSVFGAKNPYYSTYDSYLRTPIAHGGTSPILTQQSSCTSTKYDYSFDSTLVQTLNPDSSSCITDITICDSAIRYFSPASGDSIHVYTPNCYESGSSLSHFEDMCHPSINPTQNDKIYAMSNQYGGNKRFLTQTEKNVLCDLGYTTNSTYGNNTVVLNSEPSPSYSSGCSGISIMGVNDGITGNSYSYIMTSGSTTGPIYIADLLANDYGSPTLDHNCIEVVIGDGTIDHTANPGVEFEYTGSTHGGVNLLRYTPKKGTEIGNITYIYIYVTPSSSCTHVDACNLVVNGDFEEYITQPFGLFQFNNYTCGWLSANVGSPDLFHHRQFCCGGTSIEIPCNDFGYEPTPSGRNYAGVGSHYRAFQKEVYAESFYSQLASPLSPNTTYTFKMDVSSAEGMSQAISPLSVYISDSLSFISIHDTGINIGNDILLEFTPVSNTNGWTTLTASFTTDSTAGEKYLAIGNLTATKGIPNPTPGAPNTGGCTHVYSLNSTSSYYYIDNISLMPVAGLQIHSVIDTFCNSASADTIYGTPSHGTFTGPGITDLGNGSAVFSPSVADTGIHTIVYTLPGNSCGNVISTTIRVNSAPSFSYSLSNFCEDDSTDLHLATFFSTVSGSFSSSPFGLKIDTLNGIINLDSSDIGNYVVSFNTYDSLCPSLATDNFTIHPRDSISFYYPQDSICETWSNPIPILGSGTTLGGTFSSSDPDLNLNLNTSTGEIGIIYYLIDKTHTVTYNTTSAGNFCPTSDTASVTIVGTDDPSFHYSSNNFCQSITSALPTISGDSGGYFVSSSTDLDLNSLTGEINPNASKIGSYTVKYITTGFCPDSSEITINILEVPEIYLTDTVFMRIDKPQQFTSSTTGTWSGLGISSTGLFDPETLGLASYGGAPNTLTFTASNGCSVDTNVIIGNIYGDTVFCSGEAPFTFSTGAWINVIWDASPHPSAMDSNGTFHPDSSNIGINTIGFTYNGWRFERTIEVFRSPKINIFEFCLGSDTVEFEGIPSGGFWQGPGIIDSTTIINTIDAGVGYHNYVYTIDYGAISCSVDSSVVVHDDHIVANFNGFCLNGTPVGLSAIPEGGLWFGSPGIDYSFGSPIFNPIDTMVSVGFDTLYYVSHLKGCTDTLSRPIKIDSIPPELFVTLPLPICTLDDSIQFDYYPINFYFPGVWSGSGVSPTGLFDASMAGPGNHTLYYDFDNPILPSCSLHDSIDVYITPNCVDLIAPTEICAGSAPFNVIASPAIPGGIWSGSVSSTGEFNPAANGPGTYVIGYSFVDDSLVTITDSVTITVLSDYTIEGLLITSPSTYGGTDEICFANSGNTVDLGAYIIHSFDPNPVINWTGPAPNYTSYQGSEVSVDEPGTYIIESVSSTGCPLYATFTMDSCCLNDTAEAIIVDGGIYEPGGTDITSMLTTNPTAKTLFVKDDITFKDYFGGNALVLDGYNIIVDGRILNTYPTQYAGITIENSDFTLINSTAESKCDVMWGGFDLTTPYLGVHRNASFQNNEINDALIAIYKVSVDTNHARYAFQIDSNSFNNNFVGIRANYLVSVDFSITNNNFNSSPNTFKPPYSNHISDKHMDFWLVRETRSDVLIKDNTFDNSIYGMYLGGHHIILSVESGNVFTNCYAAGIYSERNTNPMSIEGCTFNIPGTFVNPPQAPTINLRYGIWTDHRDISVTGCNFYGGFPTITNQIGIYQDQPDASISSNDNFGGNLFQNLQTGLSLMPYGFVQPPHLTPINVRSHHIIEDNLFDANGIGINFRPNYTWTYSQLDPQYHDPALMIFDIHCNEFNEVLNLPSSYPDAVGINVEPNTYMGNMGDCIVGNGITPSGNGWPADNMIGGISNWTSPSDWISINNAGDPFTYFPYGNEFVADASSFVGIQDPLVVASTLACQDQTNKGTTGMTCTNLNIIFAIAASTITVENDDEFGNPYPNPTNSLISVPYKIEKTSDMLSNVKVVNSTGAVMLEKRIQLDPDGELTLDVNEFPPGAYFVIIETNGVTAKKSFGIIK